MPRSVPATSGVLAGSALPAERAVTAMPSLRPAPIACLPRLGPLGQIGFVADPDGVRGAVERVGDPGPVGRPAAGRETFALEAISPIEADRWALDAGDVLNWLESAAAGTDGVVRLAVET